MREFFKGWRRKAGCVIVLAFVLLIGMWPRSDQRQIQYLFHYNLTDKELAELPKDVAILARGIQAKAIDSIPRAQIDELLSGCPHREKGSVRDRFVWGLDGNKPQEGDRCVWLDLNVKGEIVGCGLVFMG